MMDATHDIFDAYSTNANFPDIQSLNANIDASGLYANELDEFLIIPTEIPPKELSMENQPPTQPEPKSKRKSLIPVKKNGVKNPKLDLYKDTMKKNDKPKKVFEKKRKGDNLDDEVENKKQKRDVGELTKNMETLTIDPDFEKEVKSMGWKVFKPQTIFPLILGKCCMDSIFADKNKVQYVNGKVDCTFRMCKKCFKGNVARLDIYDNVNNKKSFHTTTTSFKPKPKKTPPEGYVCMRCNIPGHWYKDCAPTQY